MVKKIDHIGIAVKNLDEQVDFYSNILGMKWSSVEEVADQKLKVAVFLVGDVRIELLQPTADDSPIAKFIKKRGEGIHHLAYLVSDIESKLNHLEEKHIRLIDSEPRLGAENHKIAFLHPKSTFGVLTELCEN